MVKHFSASGAQLWLTDGPWVTWCPLNTLNYLHLASHWGRSESSKQEYLCPACNISWDCFFLVDFPKMLTRRSFNTACKTFRVPSCQPQAIIHLWLHPVNFNCQKLISEKRTASQPWTFCDFRLLRPIARIVQLQQPCRISSQLVRRKYSFYWMRALTHPTLHSKCSNWKTSSEQVWF